MLHNSASEGPGLGNQMSRPVSVGSCLAPHPASKSGYRIILSLLSLFLSLPYYVFFSDEIIHTYVVLELLNVAVVTHKQNNSDALVLTYHIRHFIAHI